MPTSKQSVTIENIKEIVELSVSPIAKDVAVLSKQTTASYLLLTGNGNPSGGLIYIVQTMGDRIKAIEDARLLEKTNTEQRKKSVELRAWQVILLVLAPFVNLAFSLLVK